MISYLIPVENQTDNSLKRRYTVLCQRVNSSFGWHFLQVDPTFKCLVQSPWIPLWMCQRTSSSQILDLIISLQMDHLKVNGPHLISKVRQYAAKIVWSKIYCSIALLSWVQPNNYLEQSKIATHLSGLLCFALMERPLIRAKRWLKFLFSTFYSIG